MIGDMAMNITKYIKVLDIHGYSWTDDHISLRFSKYVQLSIGRHRLYPLVI